MIRIPSRISVVINNFNYGKYLSYAIDSVLKQKVENLELVVVDDGSTDNSREIINQYTDRFIKVFKVNGGQASAFNAGFAAASGDWIWFLDADDFLNSDVVEKVSQYLDDSRFSKIQGYLEAVNQEGISLNYKIPSETLSQGNVIDEIISHGNYSWPPTTGNIFSRKYLSALGPVPENEYRICGDLYLCTSAAFYGEIKLLEYAIGSYRIHESNNFFGYKLDSGKWLNAQAQNLIQAQKLVSDLVKEHMKINNFSFPWSRRNLELLMVAKRFSTVELVQYDKLTLSKLWWRSIGQSQLKWYAKVKAVAFWTALSVAPKKLARMTIKMASGNFLKTS